jgi:YVTN family beta-propeller protein
VVSSATTLTATLTIDGAAALGDRNVTVTTAGGASTTMPFTVLPLTATLTSVSPAVVVQGTTQTITLAGTDFVPGATNVVVTGAGVVVSNVNVSSATALTMDVAVAAAAALGARTVTVTTAGGTSGGQTLTINPPVPALTTVTPSVGVQGSTQSVTLAGSDFVPGATTVDVSGTGVTVSNVVVTGTTSLTADVSVAAGAPLGAYSMTVSTIGGTSGAQTFTVNPPPPTLVSATPNEGIQGSIETVTLTGTDFVAGATAVNVSGSGIAVDNVNVASSTSLTVNLDVAASAALGGRTITVTTAGGTSNTVAFTMLPPPPTLASVAPSVGVQGTTQAVTLVGTDFVAGATTVNVSGANVVVSDVSVSSGTTLTADFAIGAGAALGGRTVTVTTAGGTSGGHTFTVNPPAPTLASVTPGTGAQGGTRTVTLTGTAFVPGATTVSVSGAGVTASNVNVTSATSLTANFATSTGAAVGARNVTVTTAGGTSGAQSFTVLAAPSITSFAALATHLTVVQPVTVAWATTDAANCSILPTFFTGPCNGSGIVTPGANVTYTLTATSAGASVSASTSVFVNEPGRWVFASASGDNQLRTFSLSASNGDLSPVGAGTVGSGSQPSGVAVDPAGKYVYAVNIVSDNVSMYTIDPTTGALTANGTIASGNDPVQITVDPTGRYAYVVNRNLAASTGSISQYTINASGQLVANGTVTIGNRPHGITIEPLGRYAYVANRTSGTIEAFAIGADGKLTSLGTVPKANAMYLAADPSGRFLYSANNVAQTVSQWSIGSNGTLISSGPDLFLGGTIRGITVDATGRFVHAADFNNNIMHWYAINQTTGVLGSHGSLALPGGPFIQPEMIATDPQGKFLYSANSGNNTVTIFNIDSSTGALSILRSVAAGAAPLGIAVSR